MPLKINKIPFAWRLSALSLLVIVIAGVVSWLNLDATRSVSSRANTLVAKHIPQLREIGALQEAVHQRVLNLYLYYATTEQAHWLKSEQKHGEFAARLSTLEKLDTSRAQTERLQKLIQSFDQSAQKFHQEMRKNNQRDWDVLRDHLASSQVSATKLEAKLVTWAETIRSSAGEGGSQTTLEISRLNRIQIGFSVVILFIALFVLTMLRGRVKDQADLYHHAYFDRLTGLPNRRRMEADWLDNSSAVGNANQTALLLINLDRYQLLTGTFGHALGDQAVLVMSDRLRNVILPYNQRATLYQFAPATWLIVFNEPPDYSDSIIFTKLIVDSTLEPLQLNERELSVTCSIGVTYFPAHGTDVDSLLRNADSALREAQSAGGGRYTIYHPDMQRRTEKFLSIESALRNGYKHGEFELFFQPKINALNLNCIGAEALIRWRRDGKLVPPFEFIPVAEESGLIIPIGHWVIEAACQQWRAWIDGGIAALPIAVNVSVQQFQQPGFAQQVSTILAQYEMPANMLELEITEEATFGDPQQVVATLQDLKKIGVSLAIDDFGTGYSSLSYLKSFPVDILKIDQVFVRQMESSARDHSIVNMMVTLARELGFKVVAEGVETEYQQESLRSMGCDFFQGYLYSKPLPVSGYHDFLYPAVTSADHQRNNEPISILRP